MFESVALIALLIALFWVVSQHGSTTQPSGDEFPVRGKVVYADEDETSKPFFSSQFKIRAKPDFLIRRPDGELVLVEYKSRKKPPNQGDVAQVIATAIAVRTRYPELRQGYIYTRGGNKPVDLSGTNEELLARIEKPLKAARNVKMGGSVVADPVERKCRSCSFRDQCRDRV